MSIVTLRERYPNKAIRQFEAKSADAWAVLTQNNRDVAAQRALLVRPIVQMAAEGCSVRTAIENLLLQIIHDNAAPTLAEVALSLGRKGKPVQRSTLHRWVAAYLDHGILGLATKHQGRKAREYDWEPRALYHLHQGSNHDPGTITVTLQQEGFEGVTYSRVHAWYKRLPTNVRYNRGRMGELAHDNTRRYAHRHTNGIAVGECYQADGNMMSVYLQHPTGKRPARFEITPCIDVRSRYIPGYWISDAESAESTVHALTVSVLKEDHVPIDLQADNGPGFANRRIERVYEALGITPYHGRARNPKDNGYIERWNKTLKRELLKQLPGYCGTDASPEYKKAYLSRVRKGEIQLMTLEQFRDRLDKFIHWYNHKRKHESLDGRTPAQLWRELKRNSVTGDLHDIVLWDQKQCTVSRECVRLMNREYGAQGLQAYHRERVIVEYNVHDDSFVKILDLKGRWFCDAQLIKAAPYRSQSAMEDRRLYSERQKLKLIDAKREETLLRADMVLDSTADLVASLEASEQVTRLEPLEETVEAPAATGDLDIDLTSTDY